jgi:hypothetical protein
MTEQEFIHASNLARIRAALRIVTDTHPTETAPEATLKRICRELSIMEDLTHKQINIDPEHPTFPDPNPN